MKNISRSLLHILEKKVEPGKIVVLYGPRRVGKTTLMNMYAQQHHEEKILFVSGEQDIVKAQLMEINYEKYKTFLGSTTLLMIDEAQNIPEIGKKLKALVDFFPQLKCIASGSSAFHLAQQVGEPLVGRKWTLHLYPIAVEEIVHTYTPLKQMELFELELLYGMYPEVLQIDAIKDKQDYLLELVSSYLFKDILSLDGIKNNKKIKDLLTLLALQLGQEVSHSELAQTLGMSRITVERHLDLLEQTFIIKRLGGYAKNLRSEVSKTSKYYFYDTGVRNALINNFNPLHLREDKGSLFENFFIIEKIKQAEYARKLVSTYFWRTYEQQEIDFIEVENETITAYECKYSEQKLKIPSPFTKNYPTATCSLVHKDNYLSFLLP